jgi:glycerol-3-phosphate dehydrogenase
VVNATGAWVDELLAGLPGHDRPLVGPSKGTHLVVDPFPGVPRVALYYEAQRDGRAVLVLPWMGRWLIGSTDIRVEGDMDAVGADDAELEYILSETNALIPGAGLTREHVRFVYTGVRPLPYAPDGDVGSVSRGHIVHDHAPHLEGLLTIVGGKLTTFRALGEQAGDLIARKLGVRARSMTRAELLPGGRTDDLETFAAAFVERSGMEPAWARRLADIYGVRADAILELARRDPALASVVDERNGVIAAEVVHALEAEFARTLADVLMRRTMVGLDPDVDLDAVEAVAEVMARHQGWSAERTAREVGDYLALAQRSRPNARLSPRAVAAAV